MDPQFFFSIGSELVRANALFSAIELDLTVDRTGKEVTDHFKLIRGQYEGIEFPVMFKQQRKGKFNDILDGCWTNFYLISEKFKKILEDNRLTGWKVYPIRLFDLKGNEMEGYYAFSIVGHCGQVSYKQSAIIEKSTVPEGPLIKYYKGILFDKWDGSDFFMPDKTGHMFITKKAAEILKKNKISNLCLENIAEAETNVRYVK